MPFDATIAAFAEALGDPAAPPPAARWTARRGRAPPLRRLSQQRRGRADRRARSALSGRAAAGRRRFLPRPGAPLCLRAEAALAGADRLWRRLSRLSRGVRAGARSPYLADVARLENAWVEAYHAEDAKVAAVGDLAGLAPASLPKRGSNFIRPRGCSASRPRRLDLGRLSGRRRTAPPGRRQRGGAHRAPDADVAVRILPPGGYAFAARLREGATLADAAEAVVESDEFGTHLVGLIEAGAVRSIIPGEVS